MADKLTQQIFETTVLYEAKNPGYIHKDLVPKYLADLGIVFTTGELMKFNEKFKPDAKGLISAKELTVQVDPLLRRLTPEKLKEYLSMFDRDKDGKIPTDDLDYALTTFVRGMTEPEINKLHELAGNNNPIDVNELVKKMTI